MWRIFILNDVYSLFLLYESLNKRFVIVIIGSCYQYNIEFEIYTILLEKKRKKISQFYQLVVEGVDCRG